MQRTGCILLRDPWLTASWASSSVVRSSETSVNFHQTTRRPVKVLCNHRTFYVVPFLKEWRTDCCVTWEAIWKNLLLNWYKWLFEVCLKLMRWHGKLGGILSLYDWHSFKTACLALEVETKDFWCPLKDLSLYGIIWRSGNCCDTILTIRNCNWGN
jgi:hypothetical protein